MKKKFQDLYKTAEGEERAFIDLSGLTMLWFNTGTLCNIECAHCYIQSSPTDDRLSYISVDDVVSFLDEIAKENYPVEQIGFTGGEPFMNPNMIEILDITLARSFEVLVLTNAMAPMQQQRSQQGLLKLKKDYGTERLIIRVSLDHYDRFLHDQERGTGSFEKTLKGLAWLSAHRFRIHIAGRRFSNEDENILRKHYQALFERHAILTEGNLVLFPEMDKHADVPEITTKCWNILNVDPKEIMCASSRMVVKHKHKNQPSVIACTLLPDEEGFDLGTSLKQADRRVFLNHPHCARFCVLGGSSCS